MAEPSEARSTERGELGSEFMEEARRALEAVIMVADQPADPKMLAQLVEISPTQVEDLLAGLARTYEEEGRGFQLVKVAGGWRYQSHEDLAPYVERFILSGQTARLSAAALETLAIIAYKQPVSRAQVAAIRGVNVDGVMRTLQHRGYIDEVGRDPGPGQAAMFGTTALFLERLGINGVDELPSLGDFIPGADVVEMLEQGLRVDPIDDDVAAPADQDAAEASGEGEDSEGEDGGGGGGPVGDIVLPDGPAIDLDGPDLDGPDLDGPDLDGPDPTE
jgi:segregation and condensation protein B